MNTCRYGQQIPRVKYTQTEVETWGNVFKKLRELHVKSDIMVLTVRHQLTIVVADTRVRSSWITGRSCRSSASTARTTSPSSRTSTPTSAAGRASRCRAARVTCQVTRGHVSRCGPWRATSRHATSWPASPSACFTAPSTSGTRATPSTPRSR